MVHTHTRLTSVEGQEKIEPDSYISRSSVNTMKYNLGWKLVLTTVHTVISVTYIICIFYGIIITFSHVLTRGELVVAVHQYRREFY